MLNTRHGYESGRTIRDVLYLADLPDYMHEMICGTVRGYNHCRQGYASDILAKILACVIKMHSELPYREVMPLLARCMSINQLAI